MSSTILKDKPQFLFHHTARFALFFNSHRDRSSVRDAPVYSVRDVRSVPFGGGTPTPTFHPITPKSSPPKVTQAGASKIPGAPRHAVGSHAYGAGTRYWLDGRGLWACTKY